MRTGDLSRGTGRTGRHREAGKVKTDHQSLSRNVGNSEAKRVGQPLDTGPKNDRVRRRRKNRRLKSIAQSREPLRFDFNVALRRLRRRAETCDGRDILRASAKAALLAATADERLGNMKR